MERDCEWFLVRFGAFVGAIINFLIIALVVYFCIVVPMNKLAEMSSRKKEEGKGELSDEEKQTQLLAEIKSLLSAQGQSTSGAGQAA